MKNLEKVKSDSTAKYETKLKKLKKKKKQKTENNTDRLLNASSSSDDSDDAEKGLTEEQYLKQLNDNIKASLLKDSSTSGSSENSSFEDEESSNDSSDSIFMRKLEMLDREDEEAEKNKKLAQPKSRGKDIYERDDIEMQVSTFSDIDNNEKIDEKTGEETSQTEKINDNQKITGSEIEKVTEEKLSEVLKSSRPKVDSLEREIFSKKLLEDDGNSVEKTTYKPKEKVDLEKEKITKENAESDNSSDLEVLDVSMFDKKRTYKSTSMEEYFAKRDKQPSTSTANPTISKSISHDDDLISLSSEDESVSSATISAGSNKKRGPRQMLTQDQLTEETKRAQKDETDRVKRLEKKTEMLSQVISQSQNLLSPDEESLILDYDQKLKQPISVHPALVKLLKQHQKEGIKFMYDTCFGSINDLQRGYEGSGCILAHCMGLGKTLQLITLLHTVIRFPQLKTHKVLVICPKVIFSFNYFFHFGLLTFFSNAVNSHELER